MKRGFIRKSYSKSIIFLIIIIGIITFLGLNIRFNLDIVSISVISLATMALLFFAYSRRLEEFYLALLTGGSIYVALVNTFGSVYTGTSPIALHIVLNPWAIFIISLICSLLALLWYEKSNYKDKFPLIILVLYVIVWIILSINVMYFDDWKMENYLTVPFVILLLILHRWFRLSNLSYGLIFAFMTLHVIGTHYTYSEVPFGFWLSTFLNLGRNHFDRIVHFSFGFLLAYPLREVFIRIGKSKGFWGLYVPVEFVLAFSCIYELIEWGIAIIFGGDLGIAYLGTQGDVWDAQKDMALAGLGSVLAMLITFIVRIGLDRKNYWKEFIDSFKVKEKQVLGERAIENLLRKSRFK